MVDDRKVTAMENLTQAQAEAVVLAMADTSLANEAYFSELDGVMGDADFGTSLASGFRVVRANWDTYDHSSIGATLLNVSSALTSNTGGCSGPVWGTLFMRTGIAFRGKAELSLEEIVAGLRSAMEGIMKRGGASLGDKTLLDALDAIVVSLEQSAAAGEGSLLDAFAQAADAAHETRETTKGWVAKRGRQSFTGDRSIGTYDPGIVAVGDMAKAIVRALSDGPDLDNTQ
ncbi:MAG: dihydroxyacetone kinase subunit L [Propionibacteriaceae bacterium]|jgi:dihydroxyacetone kinase phosphoprotein-dependent L subunit|nr:dihydroxyacetone kinase subunit L [Propionibacteriaceae bacterium]